jgi:hypothetical protein
MENSCICGKAFKHASSLSRHKNGDKKKGTQPCVTYTKDRIENPTKRLVTKEMDTTLLLERLEKVVAAKIKSGKKEDIPKPVPYQNMKYPTDDVLAIFEKTKNTAVAATLLKLFHLDYDGKPEWCNIVCKNKTRPYILLWNGTEWKEVYLVDFAFDFTCKMLTLVAGMLDENSDEALLQKFEAWSSSQYLENERFFKNSKHYLNILGVLHDDRVLTSIRKLNGFKRR